MTPYARAAVATLLIACSTAALAQSRGFTRPNISTEAGAASVTLGGQTFVNQIGRASCRERV